MRRPGAGRGPILNCFRTRVPAFAVTAMLLRNSQQSSATPGCRRRRSTPLPVADLRHILTVTVDVVLVVHQPVTKELLGVGGASCETRDPIDHITDEMKP